MHLLVNLIEKFNLKKNIQTKKFDYIKKKKWEIYNPRIFEDNTTKNLDLINITSNFDYNRIQSLFSNLSSLSLIELIKLRMNYQQINYSTIEVDIQLQKLLSFPPLFHVNDNFISNNNVQYKKI